MLLSNRNIASRLSILREAYTPDEECNPLTLLEKLADHPNGNELLKSFQEFYREVQAATQPKTEIVRGRAASRVVLIDALSNAPDLKHDSSLWSEFNSIGQPSDLFSDIGDPKLVAEAMKVVRQKGIVKPPFFKKMKNSEIQAFHR